MLCVIVSFTLAYELSNICFSYVHLLMALQGGSKAIVGVTMTNRSPKIWKKKEKSMVMHFYRFFWYFQFISAIDIMYFIEGVGTVYMASALPNLKNTAPALPLYKDHQKYYITLGSLLIGMTIFDTFLNIAVAGSDQVLQRPEAALLCVGKRFASQSQKTSLGCRG